MPGESTLTGVARLVEERDWSNQVRLVQGLRLLKRHPTQVLLASPLDLVEDAFGNRRGLDHPRHSEPKLRTQPCNAQSTQTLSDETMDPSSRGASMSASSDRGLL